MWLSGGLHMASPPRWVIDLCMVSAWYPAPAYGDHMFSGLHKIAKVWFSNWFAYVFCIVFWLFCVVFISFWEVFWRFHEVFERFLKRFHKILEVFLCCFHTIFEKFLRRFHIIFGVFLRRFNDVFEKVFIVLIDFFQGFLNAYAVGHYRGMMWLWGGGMHASIATTSRHSDHRDWRIMFELFCPRVMSYFHGSM